jgi:hypothetical protein
VLVLTLQLEQEVGKVHRAHEELVQASERREQLERSARARLQGELRRVQELNRALREQLELLSTQLLTSRPQNQSDLPDMAAENLRKELGKREIFIAQLITQSKKLYALLCSFFWVHKWKLLLLSPFELLIFTADREQNITYFLYVSSLL